MHTLVESVNHAPQLAPGLLVWVQHAAKWELRKRRGAAGPLRAPRTTITRSDESATIAAATALRNLFESDNPRIAALFGAIGDAIVGGGREHRTRRLRRSGRIERPTSD